MKIFYYNYSFTEQSIRQLETMTSFIEGKEFYFDSCWRKKKMKNPKYKYIQFEEFLKINGEKIIIFFNVMDGKKLYKYRQKKEIKFVFRPRGITPEESYYKNKSIIKKKILNYMEKKSIKLSDYFIFLNEAQKIHFLSKYQEYTNKLENFFILPNLNKSTYNLEKETRKEKLKIIYSGGFSKWQNIDLIYSVVSKIIKNFNEEIVFTVLTFEKNFKKAERLAEKYGIRKNIFCKYVLPENLNKELLKHNVGIIIRDNDIINQTASPFKIIDYISSGLGLILSDNVSCLAENILDEKYYCKISYNNGNLIYSEEKIKDYIINITQKNTKIEIINNYNNYISKIKKLDIKKII